MPTTTFLIEGLQSAASMALAMESLARLPGVTGVTVTLRRQAPSAASLQTRTPPDLELVRRRLRRLGLRLGEATRVNPVA